jgi:general stress protein 26
LSRLTDAAQCLHDLKFIFLCTLGAAQFIFNVLYGKTMTKPTDEKTLWNLIEGIKFGMLTHRHTDGAMHSAPLTTQNKAGDEGSQLYFFISLKSEIASCVAADARVNVSYSHPGDDRYVSVSGTATIIEDQTKKDYLFTPFAKAWFPGGATDPDMALLGVEIGHAEFWNVTESKMVQLAKMAKAAITGGPPKSLGEHKELNLG